MKCELLGQGAEEAKAFPETAKEILEIPEALVVNYIKHVAQLATTGISLKKGI